MYKGWCEALIETQPPEKLTLDSLLSQFRSLFASNPFDLGTFSMIKHEIDTRDAPPYYSGTSRIPIAYESQVNKMVNDMLENGIIEPSNSAWNSPIVIVPKEGNEIRLCVDYRKLNSLTNRPIYPFPSSQEIFDKLGGNKYFSTLDMTKGYYQLEMSELDKEKTAFSTSSGHYHFCRMPFGLSGAPSTFQRALSTILCDEIGKSCAVYLDDIIVFGRSIDDHNINLFKVFSKLKRAGFKLSREKCVFLQNNVRFLGHVINENGIQTDPKKVEAIKNWPLPSKNNELHSFICFANYYRKFIRNFSETVLPLEKLIQRKGSKPLKCEIFWNKEAENAFHYLKDRLCQAPTLAFPSNNETFILDTDASENGMGAVLSQRMKNNEERVISYASNKFSSTQKNYCATRRELLAVITYLKMFRHYLVGRKFIVRTDHESLIWLLNWKNPTSKQYFAWIEQIMEYDFQIEHRKGSDHINADILSRIPTCVQCFRKHVGSKQRKTSKNIRIVYASMKNKQRNSSNIKEIKTAEGENITKIFHDRLGHIGGSKIFNILRNLYVWSNMKYSIYEITKNCKICLKRKCGNNMNVPKRKMHSEYPFQAVSVDITGPLPPTKKGNRFILAIIDNYTRFPVLIPLSSQTSFEVTTAIQNHWFYLFGSPDCIHSDRGTSFLSKEMSDLMKKWNVKHTTSSPYYPQGNSIVERLFKTVKDMIYCITYQERIEWDQCLKQIEFSLRYCENSSTKLSPFEALLGYQVNSYVGRGNTNEQIIQEKLLKITSRASKEKRKTENKIQHRVGDVVYAKILPIKEKSVYKPRYDGPYKILKIRGTTSFDLEHMITRKQITRNIHHLKFIRDPSLSKITYKALNNNLPEPVPPRQEEGCSQSQSSRSEIRPNQLQLSRPKRRRQQPIRYGF